MSRNQYLVQSIAISKVAIYIPCKFRGSLNIEIHLKVGQAEVIDCKGWVQEYDHLGFLSM